MSDKKDSPAEARTAHQWLKSVSEKLDNDPALIQELTGDLLDLTRDVAHGPSRPAAPLTAFLVGYAAGRNTSDAAGVRAEIAKVNELLDDWSQES